MHFIDISDVHACIDNCIMAAIKSKTRLVSERSYYRVDANVAVRTWQLGS